MSIRESGNRGVPSEPDRWEALVGRIATAASFELARRRSKGSLTLIFAGWSRRLIPAAAVVAALSGTLLGLWGLDRPESADTSPTLAQALTPEPLALWYETTSQPTLAEMVSALEGWRR